MFAPSFLDPEVYEIKKYKNFAHFRKVNQIKVGKSTFYYFCAYFGAFMTLISSQNLGTLVARMEVCNSRRIFVLEKSRALFSCSR